MQEVYRFFTVVFTVVFVVIFGEGLLVDDETMGLTVFFTTPWPRFPPGPGKDFLKTMEALGELLEGPVGQECQDCG